jgi:hypothetical protein
MRRLLVTARVAPSSPILVALMIEALSSSKTSVLTRATRRNISEDAILHVTIFLHVDKNDTASRLLMEIPFPNLDQETYSALKIFMVFLSPFRRIPLG